MPINKDRKKYLKNKLIVSKNAQANADLIVSTTSSSTTNAFIQAGDNLFSPNGITISTISHFINLCGGREIFSKDNLSIADVAESFIKSQTSSSKNSYLKFYSEANQADPIAEANIYVIASWQHSFLDYYDALEETLKGEENEAYLWIDLFCSNLHFSNYRSLPHWETFFKPKFSDFRTIVVLSRSTGFSALQSKRVLYELYTATVESGSILQVAFSPPETALFIQSLQNEFASVFPLLCKDIDILNAKISSDTFPEEDEAILRAAQQKDLVQGDYNKFNESIMEHLRGWLVFFIDTTQQQADYQNDLALALAQGKLYFAMGHTQEAEPLLMQSVTACKAKLGPVDPLTIEAMRQLAELYIATVKYPHAEIILTELIKSVRSKSGPTSAESIDLLKSAGDLYFTQQKYDEAEKYYKEVICSFKDTSTLYNLDRAPYYTSVSNLGVIYYTEGRFELAEPLFTESLQLMRSRLGSSHPDTLACIKYLALLYSTLGKFNAAEPLWKELVSILTALEGDDNEETLDTIYNLCLCAKNQGRLVEFQDLLKLCVEKRTKLLGADHNDTMNAVDLSIVLYEQLGDKQKIEPLYVQAINAKTAVLGADHADTIRCKNAFASYLFKLERFSKAECYYSDVYQARLANLGDSHPETIKSTHNYGYCLHKVGKNKEAVPLFKRVYDYRKEKLGEEHPETVQALNFMNAIAARVV